MKHSFFILLAFLAMSCNKQKENNIGQSSKTEAAWKADFQLKSLSVFEVYGIEHNEWMDYHSHQLLYIV